MSFSFKKSLILICLIIFPFSNCITQELVQSSTFRKSTSQTLSISDKEIIERLTRLEEGQKSIVREMDKRFEAMDKRFESIDKRFESIDKRFESIDKRFESLERRLDQLGNIFIGIVAAFAAIVTVTIGFAIWDRRTALRPFVEKHQDLAEREEKVERVLKGYAKIHPDLEEILKREGLL